MSGKKNIFWGVAFLLLAAVLLASKLGYLEGLSFWPILMSIILIAFLVKGIIRGSFGTILFSLAFLIIVNDELLHLEAITPWPVLGAAFLGTIGLKMLFPRFGGRWQRFFFKKEHSGILSGESRNGRFISYGNVFSSAVKYVSGEVECVDIENVFGSMNVYFVDAYLPEGKVDVNLDSVFGSVVLYVPANWTVTRNLEKVFANIKENGRCTPDGIHEMCLRGDNVFGGITIVYV